MGPVDQANFGSIVGQAQARARYSIQQPVSMSICVATYQRKFSTSYIDANNVVHGFLRARDGTTTTFDAPGAGTGSGQGTFTSDSDGLNPAGAISGDYNDDANVVHALCGFRTAPSTLSTFRAPAQAPVKARMWEASILAG